MKVKQHGMVNGIQPYGKAYDDDHLFSDHTEFEAMYIKESHLGQGSYGAAFKVTSVKNKKTFVLKEIMRIGISKREREREEEEIEILKNFSHENIGKNSFYYYSI